MPILKYTEGCYEIQDVEFGKVYKWCPDSVVVECECGQMPTFTRSETTCEWCEADYAAIVTDYMSLACEESDTRQLEDEVIHPWRYAEDREEE